MALCVFHWWVYNDRVKKKKNPAYSQLLKRKKGLPLLFPQPKFFLDLLCGQDFNSLLP